MYGTHGVTYHCARVILNNPIFIATHNEYFDICFSRIVLQNVLNPVI